MPSVLHDTREIHLSYKPQVVYLPYFQVQGNVECPWIEKVVIFSPWPPPWPLPSHNFSSSGSLEALFLDREIPLL